MPKASALNIMLQHHIRHIVQFMHSAGSDGGIQRPLEMSQAVLTGKNKFGKRASSKAAAQGSDTQAGDPPVEYLVANAGDFGDSRTVLKGGACKSCH